MICHKTLPWLCQKYVFFFIHENNIVYLHGKKNSYLENLHETFLKKCYSTFALILAFSHNLSILKFTFSRLSLLLRLHQETLTFSPLLNPLQTATRSPAWKGETDLHRIYQFQSLSCRHFCWEFQIWLVLKICEEFYQIMTVDTKFVCIFIFKLKRDNIQIKGMISFCMT